MTLLLLTLALAVAAGTCFASPAPPAGGQHAVDVRVLGVTQDGGLPHIGCARPCCAEALRDPRRRARVASIALVVKPAGAPPRVFIVDATPDFPSQVATAVGEDGIAARPRGSPVDGILLTHAHVGHYAGLMYLGRESIAADRVPVYATERMSGFLSGNSPWSRLVTSGNIELRPIRPGVSFDPAPGLRIEALRVPHREEDSDVVGFLIAGPARRLLYIPDIDDWSRWDRDIAGLVGGVDVAILDATFWSPGELGRRSMADVPHPLVPSTMDRLEPLVRQGRRVIFIHLNHTNPALRPGSPERMEVERRGFEIAADGMTIPI